MLKKRYFTTASGSVCQSSSAGVDEGLGDWTTGLTEAAGWVGLEIEEIPPGLPSRDII